MTPFDVKRAPSITIQKYLERLCEYAGFSQAVLIAALIYIDRLVQYNNEYSLTGYNIHKLLLISSLLATKFFDDHYYFNSYYAKVGGVPVREINFLETTFLKLLDFNLFISNDLFERYRSTLHKQVPKVTSPMKLRRNEISYDMRKTSNQNVNSLEIVVEAKSPSTTALD